MRIVKYGIVGLFGGTLLFGGACGGSSGMDNSNSAGTAGNAATAGAVGLSGAANVAGGGNDTGGEPAANGGSTGDSGAPNAGGEAPTDGGGSAGIGAAGDTGDAGAPASGGMAAGGRAGGGSTAGTAGVGGRAGAGGMSGGAGASGAAGAGGGGNSCPVAAPANGGTCTTVTPQGANCLYTGLSCSCRAAAGGGMGGALTWRCTGGGAACPATAPVTGGACMNTPNAPQLVCPYPTGASCRCANNDTWNCTPPPPPPPPACPATQPTGACTELQECRYGATTATRVRCECNKTAWACGAPGAGAPTCTAMTNAPLATGDVCTGVGACAGMFGGGNAAATCVCNGTAVTCD